MAKKFSVLLLNATKERLLDDKYSVSEEQMRQQAFSKLPASKSNGERFLAVLKNKPFSYICEIRAVSPLNGDLISVTEYSPVEIAAEYRFINADIISVVTERDYFHGKPDDLREVAETVDIPILRHDVIIDPYQIYQSKWLGASAVLLVAENFIGGTKNSFSYIGVDKNNGKDKLAEFIALIRSLGMEAVVEIHNKKEADLAVAAGARVVSASKRVYEIGVDDFYTAVKMRSFVPDDIIFIVDSELSRREEILFLQNNHANAVILGDSIIKVNDRNEYFKWLKSKSFTDTPED